MIPEPLLRGSLLAFRQSALLISDIFPWILAGTLAGALIRTFYTVSPENRIPRIHAVAAIPVAALSGAVSPLCTLGTLPVVTACISRGLHHSVAISFLASSSMVTPQIALMTAGFLGPQIAILQACGGILAGITAGALLQLGEKIGLDLFRSNDTLPVTTSRKSTRTFIGHVSAQLEYSLFWLVIGVLLSQSAVVLADMSGMTASLQQASIFQSNERTLSGFWALSGAVLATPLYSCGGAVLPILSALRSFCIDESFFFAFLVCGPATRIRSIAALGKILTPHGLVSYLLFIVLFSVLWAFAAGPFAGL